MLPEPKRPRLDLFGISVLILFLELAFIRWFPANVLYLAFFTNMVLLACFLGMTLGCLAAERERRFWNYTPILLFVGAAAALLLQRYTSSVALDVGQQEKTTAVFFGTALSERDPASFLIPIELVGGFFFLIIALTFVGPGQELGRALNRTPNRLAAYTLNILGSIVGIVLFAAMSYLHLPPFAWFLPIVAGIAYFMHPGVDEPIARKRWLRHCVLLALFLAGISLAGANFRVTELEQTWSPYYRILYAPPPHRDISVNMIGHQAMHAFDDPTPGNTHPYVLPYLLNRDSGGAPFENVLIIGAGSGNDVSRALLFGAKHIDAVEIDPVIQKLGARDHPNRPYDDPRVKVHIGDGRNFLRSTDKKYDLVIYALVDSLMLHSSFSNIRLESFLFTKQAYEDARDCLKPNGLFITYNYYRQGWIVARLQKTMREVFGNDPLVMTLPYRQKVALDEAFGGFTMLVDGVGENQRLGALRSTFAKQPEYWLPTTPPGLDSPNGFENPPKKVREEQAGKAGNQWMRYGPAEIAPPPEGFRTPTDDWPLLYLRDPEIPFRPSLTGMLMMGGVAFALLIAFGTGGSGRWYFDTRMFFLGAGFMLIETRAVVNMALLFGSTWMVNSVVFFAVLVMILAANAFALRVRIGNLIPYYIGLFLTLGLNLFISLDSFLGMDPTVQMALACALVFAPVLFAGVIFAGSFGKTTQPDIAFACNIAGAMVGGLAENLSMIVGFQNLMWFALAFYVLSLWTRPRQSA